MAGKKRMEGLPIALSTLGGLGAALAVLLIGTMQGGRAWIILIKAGIAFLLCSALIKTLTAGVITGVSMKRTPDEKPMSDSDEIEQTAATIAATTPEPTEKAAS